MRFKLDENLPASLVDDFKAAGLDAATCRDEGIEGAGDPAIAAHAVAEGRALITFDLDFADIRRYPPGAHPDILILRLHSQDIPATKTAIAKALQSVPPHDLQGNTVIIEDYRIRIRRP
ncbi:MAG: DUF5615 family PIN-like protein [Gemmataceae bacterium]|nr:DUF5615 family PIN-like protein [Gemmataceae bacterium]